MATEANAELDPDMVMEEDQKPVEDGLYCFLSDSRVCSSDCAAYVTHPRRAASSELNEQSSHCAVLSGIERTGRSLVMLTNMLHTKRADDARESQQTSAGQSSPFGVKR